MDDRLRETLSAMMDDEADELAVRRLLSHADQNDVRHQWQRWQQIRDLMHDHHGPARGVDVAQAVRATLDGHGPSESVQVPFAVAASRGWQWSAVATIFAALVVGFGAGAGWDGSTSEAVGTSAVAEVAATGSQPLLAAEEVALRGLDDEQLRQMRQYLLEHAQHSSVGVGRGSVGYARLVSATGNY
jgi:sigma-E factor negative regulatory protein RseA